MSAARGEVVGQEEADRAALEVGDVLLVVVVVVVTTLNIRLRSGCFYYEVLVQVCGGFLRTGILNLSLKTWQCLFRQLGGSLAFLQGGFPSTRKTHVAMLL